jgi:hypothetical protein
MTDMHAGVDDHARQVATFSTPTSQGSLHFTFNHFIAVYLPLHKQFLTKLASAGAAAAMHAAANNPACK